MSSRTLLAFDFGTKSIGVAVGQEITGTARSLASLKANDGRPDWQQIEKVAKRVATSIGHCWPSFKYGWH